MLAVVLLLAAAEVRNAPSVDPAKVPLVQSEYAAGRAFDATATGYSLFLDSGGELTFDETDLHVACSPAANAVVLPAELTFPDGSVFTESGPADHVWHKGFWFAWKYVNGTNYWGDAKAGEPAGVEPPELRVDRRIRRVPFADGGYRIDLELDVTAMSRAEIGRTPPWTNSVGRVGGGYAGLTLRLVPDATNWVRTVTAHSARVVEPRSGHGFEFRDLAPTPASKMYAWPDGRFFNPSPVYYAPIVLERGDTLRLHYELSVF